MLPGSHSNKHHSKLCTQIILKTSRMKPTGRLNLIPSLNSISLQLTKYLSKSRTVEHRFLGCSHQLWDRSHLARHLAANISFFKLQMLPGSHSNKHHSKLCTQIILKTSRMKPTGRLNLIPSLNSISLQFRKECFITTTNIYASFPKRFMSMAITCHLFRYIFIFLMADIVPFVAGTFP